MLTDGQIAELRSHFPILREKTYLYNCSQGALSDIAQSGMDAYTASWRTSSAPWDEWVGYYEGLRTDFARFINADPDEVAVVSSASAGINPIANALTFNGRRRVVMSEFEFPTMGQIWLAQQPRGAEICFLDGVDGAAPIESYRRAVDERTRIVPLTQISFLNGARSDVAAVTRIAHDNGALLFLDGFQDCGTRPVDVRALDCDCYVTGTLKYLLGPPGVAFLYVKRSLIETFAPTLTSWMAQRNAFAFDTRHLDPAPNARRFEGGSPPMPSIYMARPALAFLMRIGMANVAGQIERVASAFLQGLRDLGVASKTPWPTVGPLVVVRSPDAGALNAALVKRGIVASVRHDGVRFGFHVYNNMDDVHTVLDALKDNRALTVPA